MDGDLYPYDKEGDSFIVETHVPAYNNRAVASNGLPTISYFASINVRVECLILIKSFGNYVA